MTRTSPIRLLRDTGVISDDPAGECSLHYRNVSKSPRATRGPLYKRGLLGPLLYQRRDREDFASSIDHCWNSYSALLRYPSAFLLDSSLFFPGPNPQPLFLRGCRIARRDEE